MKQFILTITALFGLVACSKNSVHTKTKVIEKEMVSDSLILQTPHQQDIDSEYTAPTSKYRRDNSQIWHTSSTGHRSHAAHASHTSHSSHFSAHN